VLDTLHSLRLLQKINITKLLPWTNLKFSGRLTPKPSLKRTTSLMTSRIWSFKCSHLIQTKDQHWIKLWNILGLMDKWCPKVKLNKNYTRETRWLLKPWRRKDKLTNSKKTKELICTSATEDQEEKKRKKRIHLNFLCQRNYLNSMTTVLINNLKSISLLLSTLISSKRKSSSIWPVRKLNQKWMKRSTKSNSITQLL